MADRNYTSTTFCDDCDMWRRICGICGDSITQGWRADDEYFCDMCSDKVDDLVVVDSDGVEHGNLTLEQAYHVANEMPDDEDPWNDSIYWTTWEDDTCECYTEPQEFQIEVDVVTTRYYTVTATTPEQAIGKYKLGEAEWAEDWEFDPEEMENSARIS